MGADAKNGYAVNEDQRDEDNILWLSTQSSSGSDEPDQTSKSASERREAPSPRDPEPSQNQSRTEPVTSSRSPAKNRETESASSDHTRTESGDHSPPPGNSFSPFGTNLFGEPIERPRGELYSEFTFPPFTVLDARSGVWQDRKRAWIAQGIKSELGRADGLTYGMAMDAASGGYDKDKAAGGSTSIFDPVLCEMLYRWVSGPGDHILDPFAGGSVRGIVAGMLGRRYTGIDLREKQVVANREQVETMMPGVMPKWITGDSLDVPLPSDPFDMVFSCPPYADLERYSDDPRDLSTMDYNDFLGVYREIIARSVSHLADDRFAAFVVGDIRCSKGFYRGFVGDTIAAFEDAGARLYNHAILVTSAGTLALRTGRQFRASRKMGKQHQDLVVFVKGDPKRATAWVSGGNS